MLKRGGERPTILETNKEEKTNWLGHQLRRDNIVKNTIEGKGERGTRRMHLLDSIKEDTLQDRNKRKVQDLYEWRRFNMS